MPQGTRTTKVGSRRPVEVGLKLGGGVLELLDKESWLRNMERLEFVRLLLRRHAGLIVVERTKKAPRRQRIGGKRHDKERMPITLAPDLLRILLEITNRLGNASKSTVVSHLILDWAGISPLSREHVFPGTKKPERRPKRTGEAGRPVTGDTYTNVMPLAEQVLSRLDTEAERARLSRGQLLRDIISERMGTGGFERSPDGPGVRKLGNSTHDKRSYSVNLRRDQVDFLDEVVNRMNGGEKATIVSHFILDWMGISPLRSGFPLTSARRRGRIRRL